MAIEAGFVGIHGVDAVAGMDLVKIKREYGQALVLIGNVDVRVLFGSDLEAVRGEVDRCLNFFSARSSSFSPTIGLSPLSPVRGDPAWSCV